MLFSPLETLNDNHDNDNDDNDNGRDRAAMVSSSSKRVSPFGLLYIVVFFMITSFDTAKVLNYIEISSEISDYKLINF